MADDNDTSDEKSIRRTRIKEILQDIRLKRPKKEDPKRCFTREQNKDILHAEQIPDRKGGRHKGHKVHFGWIHYKESTNGILSPEGVLHKFRLHLCQRREK